MLTLDRNSWARDDFFAVPMSLKIMEMIAEHSKNYIRTFPLLVPFDAFKREYVDMLSSIVS